MSAVRRPSESTSSEQDGPWYRLSNEREVDSPALVVYPERIEENIGRMLAVAGGPARLRPHVKTYKMAEIVQRQMARGIEKFKCATIAEAEMVAGCHARDVLLAYHPVGPKIDRLLALCRKFPETRFSTLVDSPSVLTDLSRTFTQAGRTIPVFVDLDIGLHRTGIVPGDGALSLYRQVVAAPGVEAAGLHAYDGQVHDVDRDRRSRQVEEAYAPVSALLESLRAAGLPCPTVVAGGTPSFPIHAAARPDVELSPGTCLLWDRGYALECPDLPFVSAAALLVRVISQPGANVLCLDLGTKAVASEMPHPRAYFPDLPDPKVIVHNEEHLVLGTERAQEFPVGTCLYAIPWHICPTVNLHAEVVVAQDGRAQGTWSVVARARRLTV